MLTLLWTYALVGLLAVLITFPWLLPYSRLVIHSRKGSPEAIREMADEFIANPTRTAVLHLILVAFAWHFETVVRILQGLGAA